jgi:hypothetical protein
MEPAVARTLEPHLTEPDDAPRPLPPPHTTGKRTGIAKDRKGTANAVGFKGGSCPVRRFRRRRGRLSDGRRPR